MRGINVKRGVESTLERVFNNTGRRFDKLGFSWTGSTAGVNIVNNGSGVEAKIVFPGIDETKEIPMAVFNELIGYALHELGHVWFTDSESWDIAREHHGSFVSSLINGLEDPRIEQCVVDSGYAPNSRALFESLVNSILVKDGYVEPDDLKNIPFLLAIEGRRLNGYHIVFDSIVDASPWATDLHWALNEAHRAKNTREIVAIAIELNKRLQKPLENKPKDNPKESSQEPGEQEDDQGGDQGGEQQEGQPGDQPGNQPGDQPGDQPGKQKGGHGKGKSNEPREVEPRSFIEGEVKEHQAQCDKDSYPRPNVGKPIIEKIDFI